MSARYGLHDDEIRERLDRAWMSQPATQSHVDASTNVRVRVRRWEPGAVYRRADYIFVDGRWFLCRAMTRKSPLEETLAWKHVEGMPTK